MKEKIDYHKEMLTPYFENKLKNIEKRKQMLSELKPVENRIKLCDNTILDLINEKNAIIANRSNVIWHELRNKLKIVKIYQKMRMIKQKRLKYIFYDYFDEVKQGEVWARTELKLEKLALEEIEEKINILVKKKPYIKQLLDFDNMIDGIDEEIRYQQNIMNGCRQKYIEMKEALHKTDLYLHSKYAVPMPTTNDEYENKNTL